MFLGSTFHTLRSTTAATDHSLDDRLIRCFLDLASRNTHIPLQDKIAHSCLSLVALCPWAKGPEAALGPARFAVVVLSSYSLLYPTLLLLHILHRPAFSSIQQMASASCTTWAVASAVSASSTVSSVPRLAYPGQTHANIPLDATPTPSTTTPGSHSVRSFVPHHVFERPYIISRSQSITRTLLGHNPRLLSSLLWRLT